MRIYAMVKQLGRKNKALEKIPYEIKADTHSLRALLEQITAEEVRRYNEKGEDVQLIPFLTAEEIENQSDTGKVGFGRLYSGKKADEARAVKNALQCFSDGLVRVFQNDTELETLDDPVCIAEGDCFTFIRLTFLAGRMW